MAGYLHLISKTAEATTGGKGPSPWECGALWFKYLHVLGALCCNATAIGVIVVIACVVYQANQVLRALTNSTTAKGGERKEPHR
jgi:hypothetical protein